MEAGRGEEREGEVEREEGRRMEVGKDGERAGGREGWRQRGFVGGRGGGGRDVLRKIGRVGP